MAKATPKKTPENFLYDMSLPQAIPLMLSQSGRKARVIHNLKPLTNKRYFEFQLALKKNGEKVSAISTEIYRPKDDLWTDLAEAVENYKTRDDWKAGVHSSHKSEALTALIEVQVIEADPDAADAPWDIDATTTIKFRTMQSGVLLTDMSHIFRAETKAEMDEFLAIQAGQPSPTALASAEEISTAERLYKLGKKMLQNKTGYADGADVPAWHLAPTTESFFLRQLVQAQR